MHCRVQINQKDQGVNWPEAMRKLGYGEGCPLSPPNMRRGHPSALEVESGEEEAMPLPRENISNSQVKSAVFMHSYCEKLPVARNREWGELNQPPRVNVKHTEVSVLLQTVIFHF